MQASARRALEAIIHARHEPKDAAWMLLGFCVAAAWCAVLITFSHLPPLCACQLDHGAYTEAGLAV